MIGFLFFAQFSYSQTEHLEEGKMYTIFMKNGNVLQGRLTEFNDQLLKVKINDGPVVFTINIEDISRIFEIPIAKKGSIGAGLGVPYGILGFNAELAVHDYINLSAGLGTTVFAGLGYGLGAKGYFKPIGEKWRPRVSAHYGVNSLIMLDDDWDTSEKFAGLVLGLGIQGMFGINRNHGFDFDIVYLATMGDLYDRVDQLEKSGYTVNERGRVRVSLGYRFGF